MIHSLQFTSSSWRGFWWEESWWGDFVDKRWEDDDDDIIFGEEGDSYSHHHDASLSQLFSGTKRCWKRILKREREKERLTDINIEGESSPWWFWRCLFWPHHNSFTFHFFSPDSHPKNKWEENSFWCWCWWWGMENKRHLHQIFSLMSIRLW